MRLLLLLEAGFPLLATALQLPHHAAPAVHARLRPRCHTQLMALIDARRASPLLASAADTTSSWDEELDAADTTSSWDDEEAAMKVWEAQQKPAQQPFAAGDGSGVDEDAHLGLYDDSEEPSERMLRQVAEKQAALALLEGSMLSNMAGVPGGESESKAVLGSLTAVLNALTRLTETVHELSARVDRVAKELESTKVSAAATPPTGGAADAAATGPAVSWNGEVDEQAWFDDDQGDQDGPDWRDVRRLKRLLDDEAETK